MSDQCVETTDTRGIWRLRRQHLNRGHLIKFLLIRGRGREGTCFQMGGGGRKSTFGLSGEFWGESGPSLAFLHCFFTLMEPVWFPPTNSLLLRSQGCPSMSTQDHFAGLTGHKSNYGLRCLALRPPPSVLKNDFVQFAQSLAPACLQTEIGSRLGPKELLFLRVILKHIWGSRQLEQNHRLLF